MTAAKRLIIVLVVLTCGVGSFIFTIHAAPETRKDGKEHVPPRRGRQRAMAAWLVLDEAQAKAVEKADPTFHAESDEMAQGLEAERARLAAILEDSAVSDQAILDQVERVIAAGNVLERRVAQYVVAIRPHLSPDQRSKLMDLCARNVRRCGAGGPGQGKGRGQGCGGQGRGQGRGAGMGRGGHGRTRESQ
jgi:hypothetical protein